MLKITVTDCESGGRLDKYLLKYFNAAPPPLIYRLLRQKYIKLNGRKAVGGEILRPGDDISVYLPEERLGSMSAPRNAVFQRGSAASGEAGRAGCDRDASGLIIEPDNLILFEDSDILILNKPAGTLCHSAKGSAPGETLIEMALAYLAGKGEFDFSSNSAFTPALCNRLDRNTSGVVVCGKNLSAAREVCRAVAGGKAQKLYLAVVSGEVREPGVCRSSFHKDAEANQAVVSEETDPEESGQKAAVTEYTPLQYNKQWNATLLRARLVTGRSHQIRAHMQMISRPIIGDAKYGDPAVNRRFYGEFGLKSQLLHARELRFSEDAFAPGARLSGRNGAGFAAPPPENMDFIINRIFGGM